MGKSYTIQIDERQRIALLELLNLHPELSPETESKETPLDLDQRIPLIYWRSMLAELPAAEAETPRVLHGFCL